MILPVLTTLISGLVIILLISPEYLRELNPFTLFLLSVACALPVWAFPHWLCFFRCSSGDGFLGRSECFYL